MVTAKSGINLFLIAVILLGAATVWTTNGPRVSAIVGATLTNPLDVELPVQLEALLIMSRALATIDRSQSHGYAHGEDWFTVNKCLDSSGPIANVQEPDFGYWMRLCEPEPGKVGIEVLMRKPDGSWKQITAYIMRGTNTVKDVLLDLLDAGCELGFNLIQL